MTDRVERDVGDVARKWVPDPRLGVLDVVVPLTMFADRASIVLMIDWRSMPSEIAWRNQGARSSLFEEPLFTLEPPGALPSRNSRCSK